MQSAVEISPNLQLKCMQFGTKINNVDFEVTRSKVSFTTRSKWPKSTLGILKFMRSNVNVTDYHPAIEGIPMDGSPLKNILFSCIF